MGYTHYWTQKRDYTLKDWAWICADVRAILQASNVPVVREYDEPDVPAVVDEREIRFNGISEDGCETFLIPRRRFAQEPWEKGRYRKGCSFCKTNRGAYDVIVTAILAVLAERGFEVSSDGSHEDWNAGVALASRALDRAVKNPIADAALDDSNYVGSRHHY